MGRFFIIKVSWKHFHHVKTHHWKWRAGSNNQFNSTLCLEYSAFLLLCLILTENKWKGRFFPKLFPASILLKVSFLWKRHRNCNLSLELPNAVHSCWHRQDTAGVCTHHSTQPVPPCDSFFFLVTAKNRNSRSASFSKDASLLKTQWWEIWKVDAGKSNYCLTRLRQFKAEEMNTSNCSWTFY